MKIKLLDGGLATTLQGRGLPRGTWVNDWLEERPEEVLSVHEAFRLAGAQGLLTGTLRTLPLLDPRWRERALRAADLANLGAAGQAWVFGSIGPSGSSWATATLAERARARASWQALTEVLRGLVHGVVLETFLDPAELEEALGVVRQEAPDLTLVACLVPGETGRLVDGEPLRHALEVLRTKGADVVGVNCGFSPVSAARAVLAAAGPTPIWVKLPGGEDLRQAWLDVAPHAEWLGGCCGVGPEEIRWLKHQVPHG